jgi:hypothetical protein
MSRPPESVSTRAYSSATRTGLFNGNRAPMMHTRACFVRCVVAAATALTLDAKLPGE